jgi:hypothetical protein
MKAQKKVWTMMRLMMAKKGLVKWKHRRRRNYLYKEAQSRNPIHPRNKVCFFMEFEAQEEILN